MPDINKDILHINVKNCYLNTLGCIIIVEIINF